jgi:hypothetical protein
VLLQREVFGAIGHLAQNTNLISLTNGKVFCGEGPLSENTGVSLRIAYGEMKFAFSQEQLKLPDRLRRAVLEPADAAVFLHPTDPSFL